MPTLQPVGISISCGNAVDSRASSGTRWWPRVRRERAARWSAGHARLLRRKPPGIPGSCV